MPRISVKSINPALNPRPWGIFVILVLKIVRNYVIGRAEAPAASFQIFERQFP